MQEFPGRGRAWCRFPTTPRPVLGVSAPRRLAQRMHPTLHAVASSLIHPRCRAGRHRSSRGSACDVGELDLHIFSDAGWSWGDAGWFAGECTTDQQCEAGQCCVNFLGGSCKGLVWTGPGQWLDLLHVSRRRGRPLWCFPPANRADVPPASVRAPREARVRAPPLREVRPLLSGVGVLPRTREGSPARIEVRAVLAGLVHPMPQQRRRGRRLKVCRLPRNLGLAASGAPRGARCDVPVVPGVDSRYNI